MELWRRLWFIILSGGGLGLVLFKFVMFLDRKTSGTVVPRIIIWAVLGWWIFLWDVLILNVIGGFIIWQEAPRRGEWTYTKRLQRHFDAGTLGAAKQAQTLNWLDPGHIKGAV